MAIMDGFLLSLQIKIWQLRLANPLLNTRLQDIFREILGPFHTSAAWKMLHLTITADSSGLALCGNWAHVNQFSCLHFKDEENKARDRALWGGSCGLTLYLYSGRLRRASIMAPYSLHHKCFASLWIIWHWLQFRNYAGSGVSRNLWSGQRGKHWSDLKTVFMTWFPPMPLISSDWESVSPWCHQTWHLSCVFTEASSQQTVSNNWGPTVA